MMIKWLKVIDLQGLTTKVAEVSESDEDVN